MNLLTALLAFAGCASLALSQGRNWTAVTQASLPGRTQSATRFIGWFLLGAGLAVSIVAEGVGFAVLSWTLQAALATFLVAMTLSFCPRLLKSVARAYSGLLS